MSTKQEFIVKEMPGIHIFFVYWTVGISKALRPIPSAEVLSDFLCLLANAGMDPKVQVATECFSCSFPHLN
jgi:hypothetical protein